MLLNFDYSQSFYFCYFKTNNQYLGILLNEQKDNQEYKNDGTIEGYRNLKSKGIDIKRKINKIKDNKEENEMKSGMDILKSYLQNWCHLNKTSSFFVEKVEFYIREF